MNIGVYRIRNVTNGRLYIGSASISFRRRWMQHLNDLRNGKHDNAFLQRDWNRCGEKAFEFEIAESVKSRGDVLACEQKWIDKAIAEGVSHYNLSLVAGSPMAGLRHTDKTKAHLRSTFTEERRRKIGDMNRGKPNTPEQKRKISLATKGKPKSDTTRERMRLAATGRKHTQETKDKLTVARSRPYPSLRNVETGEVISSGNNLTALCSERGLNRAGIWYLRMGKKKCYRGWVLNK